MNSVCCTCHTAKCCPPCVRVLPSSWPWVGHREDWCPQGLTGKTYIHCWEHMALIRPVTPVQHGLTNFCARFHMESQRKIKGDMKIKKLNWEKFQCWTVLCQSCSLRKVTVEVILARDWDRWCVCRWLSCPVCGRKIKLKDELKERGFFQFNPVKQNKKQNRCCNAALHKRRWYKASLQAERVSCCDTPGDLEICLPAEERTGRKWRRHTEHSKTPLLQK